MSYLTEMEIAWTISVMARVSNPGDPVPTTTNATKVAQVLRRVIGDFHVYAGITVTESSILASDVFLGPALSRGLFYLQDAGGKIGPPKDNKETIEDIRNVDHSNTMLVECAEFDTTVDDSFDKDFPGSFLDDHGFPDRLTSDRFVDRSDVTD